MDIKGLINMNCDEIIIAATSSGNQLGGRFRWLSHQTFHGADIVQSLIPGQGIPKKISIVRYWERRFGGGGGLKPVSPDDNIATVAGICAVAVCAVGQLFLQLSCVLQREALKSSLVGHDHYGPGTEAEQREKAFHETQQVIGKEVGMSG